MWQYNYSQSDDELMHYGVLGMKWGMRRAKKKGTTYKYKSFSTKRYERKAAKTTDINKKKIYTNRAKASAKIDAKEQAIAKKQSLGKTLVTRVLTGGIGAKNYQRIQAMGVTNKGKAVALTILDVSTIGIGHRIAKGIELRKHDYD